MAAMARSFLAQLQRSLYLSQRGIGDARAVQLGTYAKRVLRRSLVRSIFQALRWGRGRRS
ncbi:MAG: hypothetical protein NVSMB13_19400 [Mycobacteriales bacterium]